jgi:hypothetical protein
MKNTTMRVLGLTGAVVLALIGCGWVVADGPESRPATTTATASASAPATSQAITGAPDEQTARKLAMNFVNAQARDFGEITRVTLMKDRWFVEFGQIPSENNLGARAVWVNKATGKVQWYIRK